MTITRARAVRTTNRSGHHLGRIFKSNIKCPLLRYYIYVHIRTHVPTVRAHGKISLFNRVHLNVLYTVYKKYDIECNILR